MGCREAIFVDKSTFDFPIFLLFFNAKFPIFPIFSILSFLFSYFLSSHAAGHPLYRRNSFAINSRGELWNRCIFYFHAKKPISSSSSLRAASCIADNWERGGREGPRSKPRNLMIAFPTPACPPRSTDKTDHYTFMGNCPPTPPLSQHQHSLVI